MRPGCAALVGLVPWVLLGGQSGTQYRTAAVGHGDSDVAISASGSPNAVVTVQVGSQVSGTTLALYADFDTKVTKDQLNCSDRSGGAPGQGRSRPGEFRCGARRHGHAEAGVQNAQVGIQAANDSVAAAVANGVKAQVVAEDAKVKAGRRVQLAKEGVLSKEDGRAPPCRP